jgi:hypothetical protein
MAQSFAIDEEGEKVYVYDVSEEVKVYNFDGIFIREIKKPISYPGHHMYTIGYFNNNLFIPVVQSPYVKYIYSCYDLINDSIRIIYKNHRGYNKSQLNSMALHPPDYHYQITDSTILFKEHFSDTIYQLDMNFKTEPRYIIDLGKDKLEWEVWRDQSMFRFMEVGPPFGYVLQSFVETKSFILMGLVSYKENALFAVYDKVSDSVRIFTNKHADKPFTKVYLRNDLDNLIAFPPMNTDGYLTYHDGCLYSIANAADFAEAYASASEKIKHSSEYLRSKAKVFSEIDENSNPIIVKAYLRQSLNK